MSRRIIALEFLTLDGVMQAPGGSKEDTAEGFRYGGWMAPFFDDFAGSEMDKQMKKADLLLGRKTFDIFESYWPTHTETWPHINDVTKYAVSRTRTNSDWAHSIFLHSVDEINKIKRQNGLDLQIYGSSQLVQTLPKNDLIDELWLKIFPVVLGKGKKLFAEDVPPMAFELTYSKASPSGVIFANYKRNGEVKTGDVS